MALTYTYADPYLAPQITQDREDRAIADVAVYGRFPAAHTERLIRLRAYVLACQECTRTTEDLFAVKGATYAKEFRELLPLARTAQDAATTGRPGAVFCVPLERA